MAEQVIRNFPRDPEAIRTAGPKDAPRARAGLGVDEDPLAELARLVGDGPSVPRHAVAGNVDIPPQRRDYPRRDTSWRDPSVQTTVVRAGITPQPMPGQLEDLEAELFSEMRTSSSPRMSASRDEPTVIVRPDRPAANPREVQTQIIGFAGVRAVPPRPAASRNEPPAVNAPVREMRREEPRELADDEVTLPMNAVLRPMQPAREPARSEIRPTEAAPPPVMARDREPVAAPQPQTRLPDDDASLNYDRHYDHDPAGAMLGDDYPGYPELRAADDRAHQGYDDYDSVPVAGHDMHGYALGGMDPQAGQVTQPSHQNRRAAVSARSPRRLRTMTAVAALVVVFGTIGFFGYRTVAGVGYTSTTAPLIKADTAPMKEVPPPSPVDASGPNLDATRSEDASKLVSRQEDPVDQVPVKPSVRVIGQTTSTNGTPNQQPTQKMVHSVIVHTDGSMTTPEGDTLKAPMRSTSLPSTAVTTTPDAGPADGPTDIAPVGLDPKPASDKPVSVVTVPTVSTPPKPAANVTVKTVKSIAVTDPAARPAAKPAPKAADAGPIQLAPNAPAAKVATLTPAPVPPKPLLSDSSGAEFMVQISSQRSDAEARKALQDATRKYAALGVRGGDVQQANLGSRGTYYRARLAAGSREQAQALCSQIKAQGGDCMISKR